MNSGMRVGTGIHGRPVEATDQHRSVGHRKQSISDEVLRCAAMADHFEAAFVQAAHAPDRGVVDGVDVHPVLESVHSGGVCHLVSAKETLNSPQRCLRVGNPWPR